MEGINGEIVILIFWDVIIFCPFSWSSFPSTFYKFLHAYILAHPSHTADKFLQFLLFSFCHLSCIRTSYFHDEGWLMALLMKFCIHGISGLDPAVFALYTEINPKSLRFKPENVTSTSLLHCGLFILHLVCVCLHVSAHAQASICIQCRVSTLRSAGLKVQVHVLKCEHRQGSSLNLRKMRV